MRSTTAGTCGFPNTAPTSTVPPLALRWSLPVPTCTRSPASPTVVGLPCSRFCSATPAALGRAHPGRLPGPRRVATLGGCLVNVMCMPRGVPGDMGVLSQRCFFEVRSISSRSSWMPGSYAPRVVREAQRIFHIPSLLVVDHWALIMASATPVERRPSFVEYSAPESRGLGIPATMLGGRKWPIR